MRRFLFLLISTIFLSSCFSSNKSSFNVENLPIIPTEKYEYKDVQNMHISWSDIFDQELEDYFVYFYSLNCDHCQSIKQEMIKLCLERKNIFFVQSSNQVVLKNDVFFTIGAGNVGDFAISGYPSLVEIKEKVCLRNVAGKTQILNLLSV